MREKIAAIPVLIIAVMAFAVTLLRFLTEGAAWIEVLAWLTVGLAAVNPGAFITLLPWVVVLGRTADGYMVAEAAVQPGVGIETLNRSAAIAQANAQGGIAECLREYCGDVGAPPDKFAQAEGLGCTAQFSGQIIHAGNIKYMRGMKVEAEEVPGDIVYVALEGRLLGYYRLLGPERAGKFRFRVMAALAGCVLFKFSVWALAIFTGTASMQGYIGLEVSAFIFASLAALYRK
jgi:hypothetical protein